MDSAVGRAGASMSRAGTMLTRRVTLPLVAAGAASVKMATDFNASLGKIEGLVGESSEQVAQWGDQILDLSKTVGIAPRELAESLYFITSAGIEGSEAMDVLTISAKAAAAGLGETQVIADLLTSALNAYAGTGLTAAQATDTLIAAVREGKAEPTELASSMGQVLGIASEMGVAFEEVAGAIASASTVGVNASKMVTGLQFVLTRLLDPTDAAAGKLQEVGLSAEALRRSVREDGLLATLELLRDKLPIAEFAEAVGGARGLRAALALVGKNAEQVKQIMEGTANSAGDLDKAFDVAAETSRHKFRAALASLQVAAIRLGERLLPTITRLVESVANLADRFADLSPAQQDQIIKWGLIALAAGPVLRIFGGLLQVGGALIGMFRRLGGAVLGFSAAANVAGGAGGAGALSKGLGGVGAGAGAAAGATAPLAVALRSLIARALPAGAALAILGAMFVKIAGYGKPTAEQVASVADEFLNTGRSATAASLQQEAWRRQLEHNEGTWGVVRDTLRDIAFWTDSAAEAQARATGAYKQGAAQAFQTRNAWVQANADMVRSQSDLVHMLERSNGVTWEQQNAIGRSVNALAAQGRHLRANEVALIGNLLAVGDFAGAHAMLAGMLDQTTKRVQRVRDGIARSGEAAADAAQKANGLASSFGRSGQAAANAAGDARQYKGDLDRIPSKKDTNISAPGLASAWAGAQGYVSTLNSIPPSKTTTIWTKYVTTGAATPGEIGSIRHAGGLVMHAGGLARLHGGGMPGLRADEVAAILQRDEFVWSRDAVRNIGANTLAALHRFFSRGAPAPTPGPTPGIDVPAVSRVGAERREQDLVGLLLSGELSLDPKGRAVIRSWVREELRDQGVVTRGGVGRRRSL